MSKNIKKIVSMVAAFAIVAAMGIGAYAYFTDYATDTNTATAGTFDIDLTHSIDLDGTATNPAILNPGDVHAFDFTVTNTEQKSADVYAVVTVKGIPAAGVTAKTASPYKLLKDGSAKNFEDAAEVTDVKVEKSSDNLTYIYTLPVKELSGSVEKIDATDKTFTYAYEFGMDIDALNEWEGSTVEVKIEVFAKQHENTTGVTTDLAKWEAAVRAEIDSTDPKDVNTDNKWADKQG